MISKGFVYNSLPPALAYTSGRVTMVESSKARAKTKQVRGKAITFVADLDVAGFLSSLKDGERDHKINELLRQSMLAEMGPGSRRAKPAGKRGPEDVDDRIKAVYGVDVS